MLSAASGTAVRPSEIPEFVAALVIEAESYGWKISPSQAKRELQEIEDACFGPDIDPELAIGLREVLVSKFRVRASLESLKEYANAMPGGVLIPGINCPVIPNASELFRLRAKTSRPSHG